MVPSISMEDAMLDISHALIAGAIVTGPKTKSSLPPCVGRRALLRLALALVAVAALYGAMEWMKPAARDFSRDARIAADARAPTSVIAQ